MKLPGNGKTKAAAVTACCALISAGIGAAGYYKGVKASVAREAIREERIDRHLEESAPLVPRFLAVEGLAKDNRDGILSLRADVGRLVEAQTETNKKLDNLSDTLMKYLSAQATAQTSRPRAGGQP